MMLLANEDETVDARDYPEMVELVELHNMVQELHKSEAEIVNFRIFVNGLSRWS